MTHAATATAPDHSMSAEVPARVAGNQGADKPSCPRLPKMTHGPRQHACGLTPPGPDGGSPSGSHHRRLSPQSRSAQGRAVLTARTASTSTSAVRGRTPGVARLPTHVSDTAFGHSNMSEAHGMRGAKWGANSDRYGATPGHVQPLPVQLNGTSGHIQPQSATYGSAS